MSLCPQTTSRQEANEWSTAWTAMGIEGLVGKDLSGRYTPGERGWVKVKTKTSTEAVVAGVTGSVSAPEAISLGRYDGRGVLRFVGRSHSLSAVQLRELASVLTRSPPRRGGGIDHPWPQPLPSEWSGHFQKPEQLRYVQVEPAVVVDVDTDTAMDRHRWRHLVHYRRVRFDLSPYDVPLLVDG